MCPECFDKTKLLLTDYDGEMDVWGVPGIQLPCGDSGT